MQRAPLEEGAAGAGGGAFHLAEVRVRSVVSRLCSRLIVSGGGGVQHTCRKVVRTALFARGCHIWSNVAVSWVTTILQDWHRLVLAKNGGSG